tara:strand:- start:265 stop:813 length:549 start_codon:yes stop_codon:yes gene_type:complete
MTGKKLVKALVLTCSVSSSLAIADCKKQPELGKGDWQETVVSQEASLRLLEAEFLKSLKNTTDCNNSVSAQTTSNQGGSNNGLASSPTGGASAALADNTVDLVQTEIASSGRQGAGSERYADATSRSETSAAQANDIRIVSDDTVSEEDNLKKVLREAIATESDLEKRQALITRYESLFGPL